MLDFIVNNIGTIAVAVILAAIVAAVIVKMRRDKKRGISSCGCSCSECAMHGACHRK